jgi:lipopolysaccharide export system protein LptA
MNTYSRTLALALLACLALPVAAQEAPGTRVVTIVNADSVVGEVVDGERLRRLFGNVHLRQDDTDLRARNATQHLDRDLIIFEGDVRIYDATDTLRAQRVSYNSSSRVGHARGAVRLSDAEAVLYSDSLTYFRAEKRAHMEAPVRLVERDGGGVLTSRRGTYFTDRKEAFFQQQVRLEDSTSVLTSEFGRYGTEDKRAEFVGNVHLLHEQSTRLRADTLTHHRDSKISEARGEVVLLRLGGRDEATAAADTTRRTLLFGGYGYHDEALRYSRVERGSQSYDPLVARLTTDEAGTTDTLLVRASLFETTQPDSLDAGPLPANATLHRIYGRGNARMAAQQISAIADSIVVDRLEFDEQASRPADDDIRMYEGPFAWLNSHGSSIYTQISGDTLRLSARGEAVDSLWALGRAFAVRPDSALDRHNQIRGRQMLALFREDTLRGIRVWPNAEAIFFRADGDGQLEGGIRTSGDSLSFTFRGDELRRLSGHREIEGTYYDVSILPQPFTLEGPDYQPDDRPTIRELLVDRPPLADPFQDPQRPAIPQVIDKEEEAMQEQEPFIPPEIDLELLPEEPVTAPPESHRDASPRP